MGRNKNPSPTPQNPTHDFIDKYVTAFHNNARYVKGDEAIQKLIVLLPRNDVFHEVLAKVIVINGLYSTGILALYEMAEHIVSLKVDKALSLAETTVVDQIACLTVGGKIRHNFSFATKYCAWHYPDHYPMFDSFVSQMLLAYKEKDGFSTFVEKDLRTYPKFKNILIAFLSHYGLAQYSFREIDYFLWGYGKELFPKKN